MALLLTICSIILYFLSPADLVPELAAYHLQQIVVLPALLFSALVAVVNTDRLMATQNVLVLGLWGAIFMSFASILSMHSAMNATIDFSLVVFIYFLVVINAYSFGRLRVLFASLSVISLVMCVRAIAAYHFGYMDEKFVLQRIENNLLIYKRVIGTGILSDPNDLSQFLCVSLALLGTSWKKGSGPRNLFFVLLPGFVMLYTIYLTFSRGAMFGLAAIVGSLSMKKVGKAGMLVLMGVMILALFVLGFGGGRGMSTSESNAGGRILAWGAGIGMLKIRPIFGIGYNAFTDFHDLTAHNSFVLCFAELGLVGYFIWLGIIVLGFVSLQAVSDFPGIDDRLQSMVSGTRAAFFAFLSTAWFLSRTYNMIFYILIAVIFCLTKLGAKDHPDLAVRLKSVRWIPITLAFEAISLVFVYITVRIRTM